MLECVCVCARTYCRRVCMCVVFVPQKVAGRLPCISHSINDTHRHSHTSMNNFDNSNERVHQKETLMKWHTHTTHTHTHTPVAHTPHTQGHTTHRHRHAHTHFNLIQWHPPIPQPRRTSPDLSFYPHLARIYSEHSLSAQRAFIVSAASIHGQRSEHSLSEPTLAPPSPVIAKMQ